jgi:hypothetical protein
MDDIKDRAKKIRSANQANGKTNFAEALAQLFEDLTIYDISTSTPLASRLDNILTASADRFNNGMSHFSVPHRALAGPTGHETFATLRPRRRHQRSVIPWCD